MSFKPCFKSSELMSIMRCRASSAQVKVHAQTDIGWQIGTSRTHERSACARADETKQEHPQALGFLSRRETERRSLRHPEYSRGW